MAIELAKKHNTRLHVFHISTEKEINLFDNHIPLEKKRITAEVCIHHLSFNEDDYKKNRINFFMSFLGALSFNKKRRN